jgi:L-asparaginase
MAEKHFRMDTSSTSSQNIKPRIIIHGGAGNLTQTSLPLPLYNTYLTSLLSILTASSSLLRLPNATALDVATFAVSLLEDDPLYNSGHGAVFTRSGTNELECSIMVSDGYKKRGVGCMMLQHVKNPIKLARELLVRGEQEAGEAGDHCQYSGEFVEGLAEKWGLDIVGQDYFFTKRRWDEHLRGLAEETKMGCEENGLSEWEKENYIPLGTCGAVVVDRFGTVCTATSTGGLTNKVPGRIGDTPTLGAGFWAEEWYAPEERVQMLYQPTAPTSFLTDKLSRGDLRGIIGDCLPSLSSMSAPVISQPSVQIHEKSTGIRHAVGLSGTGNGDSFLRMAAARTTAAKSRFSRSSLSEATTWMAGRDGELQKSASNRWRRAHEGTGGIIGIEVVNTRVDVVQDYNCGGMFRAWTEEDGTHKFRVFRDDNWESGPKSWYEQ